MPCRRRLVQQNVFMPASAPHSASDRIAEVLYRSLESALVRRGARDDDAGLVLRRDPGRGKGANLQMQLHCRGLYHVPVRVAVTYVGGTIFDGATALSYAPVLGEKVAAFLLGEVEKRLGQMLIKGRLVPQGQRLLRRETNDFRLRSGAPHS